MKLKSTALAMLLPFPAHAQGVIPQECYHLSEAAYTVMLNRQQGMSQREQRNTVRRIVNDRWARTALEDVIRRAYVEPRVGSHAAESVAASFQIFTLRACMVVSR